MAHRNRRGRGPLPALVVRLPSMAQGSRRRWDVQRPARIRRSVDFPAPLGPSTARNTRCGDLEIDGVQRHGATEALLELAGDERR